MSRQTQQFQAQPAIGGFARGQHPMQKQQQPQPQPQPRYGTAAAPAAAPRYNAKQQQQQPPQYGGYGGYQQQPMMQQQPQFSPQYQYPPQWQQQQYPPAAGQYAPPPPPAAAAAGYYAEPAADGPIGDNGNPLLTVQGAFALLDKFMVTQLTEDNPAMFAAIQDLSDKLDAALARVEQLEAKAASLSNAVPVPPLPAAAAPA